MSSENGKVPLKFVEEHLAQEKHRQEYRRQAKSLDQRMSLRIIQGIIAEVMESKDALLQYIWRERPELILSLVLELLLEQPIDSDKSLKELLVEKLTSTHTVEQLRILDILSRQLSKRNRS